MKRLSGFIPFSKKTLSNERGPIITTASMDWRSFQDQAQRRIKKTQHRRVLLSLLVLVAATIFFSFSLGAILKGNGEKKDIPLSTLQPPGESSASVPPPPLETSQPQEKPVSSKKPGDSQESGPSQGFPLAEETSSSEKSPPVQAQEPQWSSMARHVRAVMDRLDSKPCLELPTQSNPCRLCTSLDNSFQTWIEGRISRSMAVAGVVVAMDPATGRILALVTYNKNPSNKEAFFWHIYPAASLFKIVTATAAVDRGMLQPESMLSFNGAPYTLLKSSIATKENRYTHHVTLCNAFARSLNPVFGKIGLYLLGPGPLTEYGSAFLFNHTLPTEIPLDISHLEVPEDPMGLAGIASGLNHVTRISPVHAVWIGSVIFNGGAAPMPWLVEKMEDGSGKILYAHASNEALRVVPRSTAEKIRTMMKATITEGTCRRRFAGWTRDPVLKGLDLGGKTGNVNNDENTRKYDWFVGYGLNPDNGKKVILSVLLIHGYRIGLRANMLAHDILRRYFQ